MAEKKYSREELDIVRRLRYAMTIDWPDRNPDDDDALCQVYGLNHSKLRGLNKRKSFSSAELRDFAYRINWTLEAFIAFDVETGVEAYKLSRAYADYEKRINKLHSELGTLLYAMAESKVKRDELLNKKLYKEEI